MLPLLEEMSITTSTIRDDAKQAFVVVLDAQARNPDLPHGAVYELEAPVARELGFFEFAIVALAYAENTLFALGEWGEVVIFDNGSITEETIDFKHGPLRNLVALEGQQIACGADLQVFRRSAAGDWEEFGPGDQMRAEFPECHLEMIDGFDRAELYAAGRQGTIWVYREGSWSVVQTPTNLNYYAVHCAADGRVYLSGQGGVLAFGRGENFEILTPEESIDDVWGVALFDDIVHMAGFRAMTLCDRADFLPDGDAVARGTGTFYDLHKGQDFLWSFGMKDVMRRTMDDWQRLDTAQIE